VALIINTPLGPRFALRRQAIRRAALQYNVPCVTTMTGAQALVEALTSRMVGRNCSIRVAGSACRRRFLRVDRQWIDSARQRILELGLPPMCGKAPPFRQAIFEI